MCARRHGSIIIGFEYTQNRLPGTHVDIFRSHRFFTEVSKISKYCVITDINRPPDTQNLLSSIYDGIVDAKIIDFFPNLFTNREYMYTYTANDFVCNLIQFINDSKIKFLTVYYTGHSKDSRIILPSGELYDISFLEDVICGILPDVEILFILDCCSVEIRSCVPILPNTAISCLGACLGANRCFYLVSSSSHVDKTVSTIKGSIFTRVIFSILSKRIDDPLQIIKIFPSEVEKDQHDRMDLKISAYKSVQDVKIWGWVFGDMYRVIENDGFLVVMAT
jgi:hypothetical protein